MTQDRPVTVNIATRPEFTKNVVWQDRVWNALTRFDHQINANNTWGVRWLREDSPQFNQIIGAVTLAVVGIWRYIEVTNLAKDFFPFEIPEDFAELTGEDEMAEAGIHARFVQDNHSFSAARGVLRGLHFQQPPAAQDKLVRCVAGAIWPRC